MKTNEVYGLLSQYVVACQEVGISNETCPDQHRKHAHRETLLHSDTFSMPQYKITCL